MTIAPIKIMAVINVTPDSFSDGGKYATVEAALSHAHQCVTEGADILDIGGESTRPYSDPVSIEDELNRVLPVIDAIRGDNISTPISIDTMKAEVARQALEHGANIINDVSALRGDPDMIAVVRESHVPVIIMHMLGKPKTMQDHPEYENVVEELLEFFRERIQWITEQGVDRERLIIDPGIGFGKSLQHNLSLLKHLKRFSSLGLPVLLGHSRKPFLGNITGITAEPDRDLATALVTALCSASTISMVRVHNVAATRQALQVAEAIRQAK